MYITMKALIAFALLGVVESDVTLFCTAEEGKVCTQNEKTTVADVISDLLSSDNYDFKAIGEEDWFTSMDTFPPSSRQGIRANMRAQTALKRSRKKNALATGVEPAPLQSYDGDGFTINTLNAEYFVEYFDQKFAVDELEVEATNEVAEDTTGNSTHDGRFLGTTQCCRCAKCGCCSVSGCSSSCRRRRSLSDEAVYAELTIDFQLVMQELIDDNVITCLEDADTQCGSMSH